VSTEAIDIIRVIAITAFAGGTSFVGAIISKKKRYWLKVILYECTILLQLQPISHRRLATIIEILRKILIL
jgi:hypothetical protein